MKKVWSNVLKPSVDLGVVVFAAVLTGSLVLNARLVVNATAKPAVFGDTGLLVGTRLPEVAVAGPGEPARPLAFGRKTLLYIFSPGCEWSKADYLNLKTIAQASQRNYNVLGLYVKPYDTEAEVATYLASNPFPGEVISIDLRSATLSDDVVRRFGSTPQLLVVGPGRLIHAAWSGPLFGRRRVDAERYFGLTLPGIKMVGGLAVP